jgi:hypothetical protein
VQVRPYAAPAADSKDRDKICDWAALSPTSRRGRSAHDTRQIARYPATLGSNAAPAQFTPPLLIGNKMLPCTVAWCSRERWMRICAPSGREVIWNSPGHSSSTPMSIFSWPFSAKSGQGEPVFASRVIKQASFVPIIFANGRLYAWRPQYHPSRPHRGNCNGRLDAVLYQCGRQIARSVRQFRGCSAMTSLKGEKKTSWPGILTASGVARPLGEIACAEVPKLGSDC